MGATTLQMGLGLGRPPSSAAGAARGLRCVDLFAGFGGFSLGAEAAGASVVCAANHWPRAVEAHALNHPNTEHWCQDLHQADFTRLPDHDVLLAAPACQGHSRAATSRSRPGHDRLRATAWAVVACAEATRPRAILVENVTDFASWVLYPVWRQALERLGYALSEAALTATHFGVPQRRTRLFVAAIRGGDPFDFSALPAGAAPPESGEPPVSGALEPDRGEFRPLSGASPGVKRRVSRARRRGLGETFVTQHVTGHPGVPLHEPLRTLTAQDQWALVRGDTYRPLMVRELARVMGFPDHYGWPAGASRTDRVRGLGNAVCPPVASALVSELARQL